MASSRYRIAAVVVAVVALAGGVGAAVAASAPSVATCTANPAITDGSTTQSIRVTCSWPKPPRATVTQTVTATPTPTVSATPTGSPSPSPSPSATAIPTETPTPTPTPSPTAAATGFPDATTTGARLSTYQRIPQDVTSGSGWHYDTRGWVSVDTAGAVFSGYSVGVNVDVTASGVTIRDNQILVGKGDWGISLRHANDVTIAFNDIAGSGASVCDNAIRDIYGDSDRVTIGHNDIRQCASGVNHFNRGGSITANYIHDLGYDCTGITNCDHFNGIQLGAGAGPLMVIDGNTILVPWSQTDAIMLANDDGAQANRHITGNLLGGGGYTLYGSGGPGQTATGITVTGNRFTTRYFAGGGYWGPVAYWVNSPSNLWSGNTWADGPRAGQPVNP